MRRNNNPRRGCGYKKPGFYAEATLDKNGLLNAATWVLGAPFWGAPLSLATTIPPRRMQFFNPLATLLAGSYVDLRWSTERITSTADLLNLQHLCRVPTLGLIDHVGRSYTPLSFVDELHSLGPSRRISKTVAMAIARHTPIPIFFTHNDIPFLFPNESSAVIEMMGWEDASVDPTWFNPEWGLQRGCYTGGDHLTVNLLDQSPEWQAQYCGLTEAVFAASWITRVSYYLPSDEDARNPKLDELIGAGIELCRLEEANETSRAS